LDTNASGPKETVKESLVKDLRDGQNVSLPLLVTKLDRLTTSAGAAYLSLELSDKSGAVSAKVWNLGQGIADQLALGRVSLIGGQVDSYRSARQIKVKEARLLDPSEVDWGRYQKSARRPIEEMKEELLALVRAIGDAHYRTLTLAALSHHRTKDFWTMTAAKSFHHAYRGGLLEHTLSVARLASCLGSHYGPILNADLLVSGAVLHDIGKCWEFTGSLAADYTTPGRLLGHISMGAGFVSDLAREIGAFPEEKLLLLQHMILSHHGEGSMGSPQTPKILEAVALHHLDNLDGKLNGILAFMEKEKAGWSNPAEAMVWTGFNRLLSDFYMITPGQGETGPARASHTAEVPIGAWGQVGPGPDFSLSPPPSSGQAVYSGEKEAGAKRAGGEQESGGREASAGGLRPDFPFKEEGSIPAPDGPSGLAGALAPTAPPPGISSPGYGREGRTWPSEGLDGPKPHRKEAEGSEASRAPDIPPGPRGGGPPADAPPAGSPCQGQAKGEGQSPPSQEASQGKKSPRGLF
jgi:3'-5' exoribonuclease